ncbi:MAG: PVC-type heme-binding CxxCH protein [Planctomycetota bacterium]
MLASLLALLCHRLPIDPGTGAAEWRRTVINAASNFEAAGVADFDRDGHLDIVCGDHWYAGPTWAQRSVTSIAEEGGYRLDFANVPCDVNGDGWVDVISCNWHRQSVVWRENPGPSGGAFREHLVDTPGHMETAIAVDVDQDGVLDFLPNVAERTVWYGVANGTLVRYDVSSSVGGHGIGFGDVNGDGRGDIVVATGWFEAPVDRHHGEWLWHADWSLGAVGIAIIVHDWNGDGRADLFFGMGHDYGVGWLEQLAGGTWQRHEIDHDWSQAHALCLADVDGDGVPEVITGKRKYAHTTDPGAEDQMAIYAYAFARDRQAFTRTAIHRGDGDGLGLAPVVIDIDRDGDLDLVLPGKSGLYLYQQEPHGGPLGPDQARATIRVPDAFEVTLFASEPAIKKPIAFDFDERGRMVVAEAPEYPLGAPPGSKPAGTIKILEDRDHDGRADSIQVFADGLDIPDAVAAAHGGIYVAEAPNLWFLRDVDGDGHADEKRMILTGFGRQDTHHMVHGLVFGPEGKLLMSQGCYARSTVIADGRQFVLTPGDFFRCWPDGTGFEVVHRGFTNSWGFDWDDYGNWIANDNEGPHLIHLVEGADYGLAVNDRHDGAPGTLPGIEADHAQHHGYLVQCGLAIYSGDAFPADYRGTVLQGAPNLHRILRDALEPRGATFFARQKPDLAASNDAWHRPIAITVGADGAVYVLDWYNEVLQHVEHPLDSAQRDHEHGRIYRIAWQQAPRRAIPDLAHASSAALAANLRADNRWLRRTSQHLLAARKSELLAAVVPLLAAAESPRTRCHALWALAESRLDDREPLARAVIAALDDADAWVRTSALRVARHAGLIDRIDAARLIALAQDHGDFVRFEAALAIAARAAPLPLERVAPALLSSEWSDPFLGYAFTRALGPYREQLVARALAMGAPALAESRELLPAVLELRDARTQPLVVAMLALEHVQPDVLTLLVDRAQETPAPGIAHALVDLVTRRPDLPAMLVRPILQDLRQRHDLDAAACGAMLDRLAARDGLQSDVFRTAASLAWRGIAPTLLRALDQDDETVAEAAILACGELAVSEASPGLLRLLAGAAGRRRWALLRALASCSPDPALTEVFLGGLADPDSSLDCARGLERVAVGEERRALLARVMERARHGDVVLDHATLGELRRWIDMDARAEQRGGYLETLDGADGVLRDWLVIGPFPNVDGTGHGRADPPERELEPNAVYSALGQRVAWRARHADDAAGIVSLMDLTPSELVTAYAWARFPAAERRPATLFAGSDDAIKVWLNGRLVLDHLVDRNLVLDQECAEVTLEPGTNTVLVKCSQNRGGWAFHARLAALPKQVEQHPDDLELRALYASGNPQRGEAVFFGGVAACSRCHRVRGKGGRVGPDLTEVARFNPRRHIVRSILEPSEVIAPGFSSITVRTTDGTELDGYVHRETQDALIVVTSDGKTVAVPARDVAERRSHATSGMPDGLEQGLTAAQFVDLVTFLSELR